MKIKSEWFMGKCEGCGRNGSVRYVELQDVFTCYWHLGTPEWDEASQYFFSIPGSITRQLNLSNTSSERR